MSNNKPYWRYVDPSYLPYYYPPYPVPPYYEYWSYGPRYGFGIGLR